MAGMSYFPIQMLTYWSLHSEKSIENDENISQFITKCWDIGLKIGHSVRNLAELKKNLMPIYQQLPTYLKHDYIWKSMSFILKFNSTINKII